MQTEKPIKVALKGATTQQPKKNVVKTNVRAGAFHPGAWAV